MAKESKAPESSGKEVRPAAIADIVEKGYQPAATGQSEGQNPPSGGSNVQPPPKK